MSLLLQISKAADMRKIPRKVGLKTSISHLLTAGAHLQTFACACVLVPARARDCVQCQQLIREKVILHNRSLCCVCDIIP